MSFDSEYLDCPICGLGDFDRIGMALHFGDCEDAAELTQAYRRDERARVEKMRARLEAKRTAAALVSGAVEGGEA
jgi:hypothetical protein